VVERLEEKMREAAAVKVSGVRITLKKRLHKPLVTAGPTGGTHRAAHPALLLQEVQEHDAAQ
jgi:hypothetical protein